MLVKLPSRLSVLPHFIGLFKEPVCNWQLITNDYGHKTSIAHRTWFLHMGVFKISSLFTLPWYSGETQVNLQRTVGGTPQETLKHILFNIMRPAHLRANHTGKAFNNFCDVIINMHYQMICVSFKYAVSVWSKNSTFQLNAKTRHWARGWTSFSHLPSSHHVTEFQLHVTFYLFQLQRDSFLQAAVNVQSFELNSDPFLIFT